MTHLPSDAKLLTAYAAIVAAFIPLLIAAISSASKATALLLEARRKQWERISQLALVINNKGDAYGLWSQLLAVREITRSTQRRSDALMILKHAQTYWRREGVDGTLMEEIDKAVEHLQKPLYRRWVSPFL